MRNKIENKKILTMNDHMIPEQVGFKLSRLHTMIKKGFSTPKFFCLTRLFYGEIFYCISSQVIEIMDAVDFEDYETIVNASRRIKHLIINFELTYRMENLIYQVFDQNFPKDAYVSVRSSTVGKNLNESEDSAENPFAGLSDSFLYVRREDLIDKVKRCWASGFNTEGLIYRNKHNFDLHAFEVAVAVQEMVFGVKSFVLFTSNPNTAAKDAVIAAGYGIGEGIVQEKVPVDHYFYQRGTGEIGLELAEKTNMLTYDKSNRHGLIEAEVSSKLRKIPCLNKHQIMEIVKIGEQLERLFDGPQDIEGTITKDNVIYILQSRPIAFDYRKQRVFTNTNVTESFPGTTTALTYSMSKDFYRIIFYDCYKRLGISSKVLHNEFAELDSMIAYIKGGVYYNLNSFYYLHSQSPLFRFISAYWEDMIGLSSSYQTNETMTAKGVLLKTEKNYQVIRAFVILLRLWALHGYHMASFHRWWEHLIKEYRGASLKESDPLVLEANYNKVWRETGNYWGVTLVNDAFLFITFGTAKKLLDKWKISEKYPSLLSDMLCGDEQLLSVKIVQNTVELAEKIRKNKKLCKLFEKDDKKEIWLLIKNNQCDIEFCKEFKYHLHKYGDRGVQELKMEQPNLRHTPYELIRILQEYIKTDITVHMLKTNEERVRLKAEIALHRMLKGQPARYMGIKKILKILRKMIRYRENSRYCRSELFGFSKNTFRKMGNYYYNKGILKSPKDIFHLTVDEIFGYVNGTGTNEDLQTIADLRKKEFEENNQIVTNEMIRTMGPIRENSLSSEELAKKSVDNLQGLGSSSGRVRGTAKVIFNPNEPLDIKENMILVTKETDPGWIFLMLSSKGIVVEHGSMLSHTAITGRKFGIPTVVAVKEATTLIPDGAEIEIDGASGLVTILSKNKYMNV